MLVSPRGILDEILSVSVLTMRGQSSSPETSSRTSGKPSASMRVSMLGLSRKMILEVSYWVLEPW